MVGSILRNSDALIWLSQLRNKDDYAYQHSINVCILMLSLGRHLALSVEQLANLGIAGLLQDVGVLMLPEELIHKKGSLTPEEFKLAKSHVEKSLELLHSQPGISRLTLDAVTQHHERFDGSGYPRALKSSEISLYGSIAGIADCYDAMISERPYAPAKSSFQALMVLYELKGRAFNAAVVERFIQCIGIYPIGSVVELNTGDVAIVVEQRKGRRLKPKLLVVLDQDRQRIETPLDLDLLDAPTTPEGAPYSIREVLGSGAHGIDPAEYFLV
jgi:HD-GYP domain-containing protein (c-di-GMP phosphodiesterase class II)